MNTIGIVVVAVLAAEGLFAAITATFRNQICRQPLKPIILTLSPAIFDCNVLTLNESWPSGNIKNIKIVVAYPPRGSTDTIAR